MGSRVIRTSLAASAAIAVVLASSAAFAQTHSFDIPAENAGKSIPEFARQAGIQIIAPGEELRGVTTPAVKGPLDTRAALQQLLAGTGVEIASDDGQTVILKAKPKNVQAASEEGAAVQSGSVETVTVIGTHIRGIQNNASPVTTFDRHAIQQSGFSTTQQLLQSLPQNFNGGITNTGSGLENAGQNSGNNLTGGVGVNLRGLGPMRLWY